MSFSIKPLKAIALGAAVCAVSLVAGVGAASATPATWSFGAVKFSGSITVSTPAGPSITCPSFTLNAQTSASNFIGSYGVSTCTRNAPYVGSGDFSMWPWGAAQVNAGAYSLSFSNMSGLTLANMLGGLQQTPFQVPFTNGAGATPSKAYFNNTLIGSGLRVTGTLNVTTPAGGLITVS